MDVKDCAIERSAGGSRFVATVFDRSGAAVASFSLMAATTGRIVIGNGENIVNYDVSHRIAPGQWTQVWVSNRYRVHAFSTCTVSRVTFENGRSWSMPTPEF
jgi:hypothetical protein